MKKNLYLMITCMLLTLCGFSAEAATKTVTVKTNDTSGLQVRNPKWVYGSTDVDEFLSWADASTQMNVTLEEGENLVFQAAEGKEIQAVKIGTTNWGKRSSFGYDDLNENDVVDVTVGAPVDSSKTITITTNIEGAVSVSEQRNYQTATWSGTTGTLKVPENAGLQISANSGYSVTNVKIGENDKGTQTYFQFSDFADGDTFTVTVAEKQPKVVEIVGNKDQIKVSFGGSDVEYQNDKWTVSIPDGSYSSVDINPLEGFAIKSAKNASDYDYKSSYSKNVQLYSSNLPDGTTTITVESYNIEESRTASFSIEIEGDGNASDVKVTRNGEYQGIPVSEFNNIKFNPETELPIKIAHVDYNKTLYKVTVGEDVLAAPESGNEYTISTLASGTVIKVAPAYPDVDVNVTFTFTNEGTQNAITLNVDGESVPAEEWQAHGYTWKLGQKVGIYPNNSDFDNISVTVNGGTTTNFIVTEERGYTVNVTATKKPTCKLTVLCDDIDYIYVTKDGNKLRFEEGSNEMELTQGAYIGFGTDEGWKLTEVIDNTNNGNTTISGQFSLNSDMTVAVYLEQRNKTAVIYVEESDKWSGNGQVTIGSYPTSLDINLAKGYNFVNYAESDRPFSLRIYQTDYSATTYYYLNGTKLENIYSSDELTNMPENSVIKIFTAEPASHTVNYTIADGVNAKVAHDYLTEVASPGANHSLQHGTHVVITPVQRTGLIVKANDAAVSPDAEGRFVVPVTADTSISIANDGHVGVNDILEGENGEAVSFEVYNLQGIRVLSNASADDVRNLPAGIYIVNGKKVAIK